MKIIPPDELPNHPLPKTDHLLWEEVGCRQVDGDQLVGDGQGSLGVWPALSQGTSSPPHRLEGLWTLPRLVLRLEHVVGDVDVDHLPPLQILGGQAEYVLLLHLLLGGDDLALDGDAELGAEELGQGEGGEEAGVAVEGLLVHHQLVLRDEHLHVPGQAVAGVVRLVGVHPLLLVSLHVLRAAGTGTTGPRAGTRRRAWTRQDLGIVGDRVRQVLQPQGSCTASSFPAMYTLKDT